MMLKLNDGRNELWQWDTGRRLTVDAECSEVHFSNKVYGRSIDVAVIDGTAAIPDILLQVDKELYAWGFVGTPENGYTKISKVFRVNRRNKPEDYVFTPPDQTTLAGIMEELNKLKEVVSPEKIGEAVNEYLEENPVTPNKIGAVAQNQGEENADKILGIDAAGEVVPVDKPSDGTENAVTYTKQELTAEEQAQARENIDAAQKPLIVTFTSEQTDTGGYRYFADCTYQQVMDAVQSGRVVKGRSDNAVFPDITTLYGISVWFELIESEYLPVFKYYYFSENKVVETYIQIEGTNDVFAWSTAITIPANTSDLNNDSGFITNIVSDLANYYAKKDIDKMISTIPKFAIAVVDALPTSDISTTTVYLVRGGSGTDLYTEYIYVDGEWEILGSQRVDLTGYATETWVNAKLADYVPVTELQSAVNTALAQAKESGEFDGEDGASVTITNTTESTEDGGENVVEFSDGNKMTVRNGKTGAQGDPGVYVGSEDTMPKGTRVRIDPDGEAMELVEVDDTLKLKGYAADAKVTGEKLSELSEAIANFGGVVAIPDYWENAVNTAVSKVKALQTAGGKDCVSFVWASDPHIPDNNGGRTDDLGKVMAKMLDNCEIPFAVITGDIGPRGSYKTRELLDSAHQKMREHLSPLWGKDRLIIGIGNHDGCWGAYTADDTSTAYRRQLSPEEMWQLLFRYQALDFRRVFSDDDLYYYVDIPAQKSRIIILNSQFAGEYAEDENGFAVNNRFHTSCYGQAQLDWLADVALDMPDGYGAIITAHVPPNETYNVDRAQLIGIVNAYCNKTTYSGSYAGVDGWTRSNVSVDFTGAKGEIIAMFAGHIHYDGTYTDVLDCPLITITSAGSTGNNKEQIYDRPSGTDQETSFDVVTINRATKTIYCTRIGAGTDRVVGYGGTEIVTYSVTNNLTNCTNSNSTTTIAEGTAYSATITANSGYVLDSVSVTMGGSVVTVTDGVINIASVTGDIVITATATAEQTEPTYTNIFDKNKVLLNARYNSSRKIVEQDGVFITGYYPVPDNFATEECYLYVKGVDVTASANTKLGLTTISSANTPVLGETATASLQFNLTTSLGIAWETLDADSLYYKLDLRRNGEGNVHSYIATIISFGFAVYVGTAVLTTDDLPDLILSFEPIE